MTTDRYPPGTFCWADIATTDMAGARSFYMDLFGWTAEDFETDGTVTYTIFRQDDGDVCGLGPMPQDVVAAGVPPHWSAYVAVDSVDASVRKAEGLGGAAMMPPMTIPDAGRMAIIRDPQGAVLSLWQTDSPHRGYAAFGGAPNTVCWNELMTPDTDAATRFYGELFDWRVKESPTPWGAYYELLTAAGTAAGMLPITEEMGEVPPNWLVYVSVADCDATARRAAELGGGVIRSCADIPDIGRFAVVHDPRGAVFAVIALEAKPD